MFHFVKNLYFLQNMVSWFICKCFPNILFHNAGKYFALKKAFYLSDIDDIEGDYIEFGVFTGASSVCALWAAKSTGIGTKHCQNFFGFDSFEGFGDLKDEDKHPFYTDQNFAVSYKSVSKRLNKAKYSDQKVKLIKGFFNETCDGKKPSDYGIGMAKVILVDSDTKSSAASCLNFVTDIIQPGTVIVIDDFFSYRGHPSKGAAGAFYEWQAKSPLEFRQIDNYGMGGAMFMACEPIAVTRTCRETVRENHDMC